MSAPSYYEEQEEIAKLKAAYHLQVQVDGVTLPTEEDLEKFIDISILKGSVVNIFFQKERKKVVSIGDEIEIRISPTYPKSSPELMPSSPAICFEDLLDAAFVEVYLDGECNVLAALLQSIPGKTDMPVIL